MSSTTTTTWKHASELNDKVIKNFPFESIPCRKHLRPTTGMEPTQQLQFKAHRPIATSFPPSSLIAAACLLPGPSETFSLRYISKAAFADSSFWLPSPVSFLLGYPMKLCLLDVNDTFKRPYQVDQEEYFDDPHSRVAKRFMTECDVMSEEFGKVCGSYLEGELRGTALMVCVDGRVPNLKFLECMNEYIRKQLVLVGAEVERLRKRGNEDDMRSYRESVRDGFSPSAMQRAWKQWQRKEAEARAKLEADKKAADREFVEAAEALENTGKQ